MVTCKPQIRRKIRYNGRRSSKGRPCSVPKSIFRTLGEMVQDYIGCKRPAARRELAALARLDSLERAIEIAALGQTSDGERSSHHYRRSQEELYAGKKQLIAASAELRKCKNFEQLHNLVGEITHSIRGLGELYTYDAAHTIGTYLGFQPVRIYLHTGTRKGASALGVGRGLSYLQKSDFPVDIQVLKAHELEDFLCIYAGDLKSWVELEGHA